MQDTVRFVLDKSIREMNDFLSNTTPYQVIIDSHNEVKNMFEG